jgi:chromosome segregation ATPase
MDKKIAFFVCVLIVLCLFAAGRTGYSQADTGFESHLRHKLAMEEEASKLLAKKLLSAYEEKAVLEKELKDKEKELKALEKELAGVRKMMEREIAAYRKRIKKVIYLRKKNKVREYIEVLEEENKGLQEKLVNIEKEMEAVLATLTELKEKFAAAETAPPESLPPVRHANTGKVLSISKEFDFIIIEFKGLNNVEEGKVYRVFRKENEIGKVEITSIRGEYVFARILAIPGDEEIKEGDIIK